MNVTLLRKLSDCFRNVEILHMNEKCSEYGLYCKLHAISHSQSSKCDNKAEEWKETLKMLFEDENIFPKIQNFFVGGGDVSAYSSESYPKLPACKRPLNLLRIYGGMA
ncbi:hypothetical protein LOAG_13847, partial [Loa loa]